MSALLNTLLQVVVVDDEALARMRLCSLLAQCRTPGVQVAAEFAQADEALAWLTLNRCDIALLDIHMPGQDGLQLAQALGALPGPHPELVFVTAHAQHAVEAFEVQALDYLTKPVRLERLQATLARVALRMSAKTALTSAATHLRAGSSIEPVVVVSDMGRKLRVPVREILYLKAELKYITLRTAHHTFVLDGALSDFEQRLGENFLRVHRNALVARRAMVQLERRHMTGSGEEGSADTWGVLVTPSGEWLAVSRRLVAAVKEAIEQGAV
jgi:two-component system, LytTR family, response regulator AlgR